MAKNSFVAEVTFKQIVLNKDATSLIKNNAPYQDKRTPQ